MILLSNIRKPFINSQIFSLVILIHIPILSPFFFIYSLPRMFLFWLLKGYLLPFSLHSIFRSVDDSLYVCLK